MLFIVFYKRFVYSFCVMRMSVGKLTIKFMFSSTKSVQFSSAYFGLVRSKFAIFIYQFKFSRTQYKCVCSKIYDPCVSISCTFCNDWVCICCCCCCCCCYFQLNLMSAGVFITYLAYCITYTLNRSCNISLVHSWFVSSNTYVIR